MEADNKQYVCTGDCIRCGFNQRQYCAAQFTYNTMRMMEGLVATVTDLKTKVDAIQGNEALLFDPTKEETAATMTQHRELIAQEGDGAEE